MVELICDSLDPSCSNAYSNELAIVSTVHRLQFPGKYNITNYFKMS